MVLIKDHADEERTMKRIASLAETSTETTCVRFESFRFTDAKAAKVIQSMREVATLDRVWDELQLEDCYGAKHYRDVMAQAMQLDIVKSMIYKGSSQRVRGLEWFPSLPYPAAAILGNCGRGGSRNLQKLSLQYWYIEDRAANLLGRRLANNNNDSTLETLILLCKLQDHNLAILVAGCRHLKRLDLVGPDNCGDQTLQALAELLSAPNCRLQSLDLSSSSSSLERPKHGKLNISQLLQNTNDYCTSLKILKLNKTGLDQDDTALILKNLHTFPNLSRIDLSENNITNLETVKSCLHPNTTSSSSKSSLRGINVSRNPFILVESCGRGGVRNNVSTNDRNALIHLIHHFPLLMSIDSRDLYLGSTASSLQDVHLETLLDWNRCGGRVVFLETDRVPLALWPLVLARVNKVYRSMFYQTRRNHCIFQLLRQGFGEQLAASRYGAGSVQTTPPSTTPPTKKLRFH